MRDLVHQVNNLLGAIRVQVEVARAAGTDAAAREALAVIERSAARTEELVARLGRAAREGA